MKDECCSIVQDACSRNQRLQDSSSWAAERHKIVYKNYSRKSETLFSIMMYVLHVRLVEVDSNTINR